MRVLVTGATGFVGSHLTERLVAEGYTVNVLAHKSSDVSFLKSLGVEIIYGDIRDVDAVEKAVKGCKQVYHLAAATSWRRSLRHEYYAVNVKGTESVARAAMKAEVSRLVYCSSVGVYGIIMNSLLDECSQTHPNSLYRETKLAGEQVLLSWHKKNGLPIVIARLSTVFGPRSLNLLGHFQAIAAKRFRFIGSGGNHVHMVYISDVVDGLRRCAKTARIEGETYIIAGMEPIKLKQLVDMIAQELEIDCPSTRLPAAPFHAFRHLATVMYRHFGFELPYSNRYELFLADRAFNISKAQKELGYNPRVSMIEGIQETVKWYRENGYI